MYVDVVKTVKRGFFERLFSTTPFAKTKEITAREYRYEPIQLPKELDDDWEPSPAAKRQEIAGHQKALKRAYKRRTQETAPTPLPVATNAPQGLGFTEGLLAGAVMDHLIFEDNNVQHNTEAGFQSGNGGEFAGGGASGSWGDAATDAGSSSSTDSGSFDTGSTGGDF